MGWGSELGVEGSILSDSARVFADFGGFGGLERALSALSALSALLLGCIQRTVHGSAI